MTSQSWRWRWRVYRLLPQGSYHPILRSGARFWLYGFCNPSCQSLDGHRHSGTQPAAVASFPAPDSAPVSGAAAIYNGLIRYL